VLKSICKLSSIPGNRVVVSHLDGVAGDGAAEIEVVRGRPDDRIAGAAGRDGLGRGPGLRTGGSTLARLGECRGDYLGGLEPTSRWSPAITRPTELRD
jgi:hypothetical protein